MADKNIAIIIKLKDLATRELTKLKTALTSISKTGFAAASKAASGFVSVLSSVKSALFSLQGLVGAIGLGALAKSFIDAASKAENLRVRLSVLTGSIAEGNRLFKEMTDLASRVPQTFEDILEASTRLIGVVTGGVDQVKQLMPLILDLSTATSLSVNDVTAQVIRMWSAGAAAADMFRERGVLAMLGFQAGADYSVQKTRDMLIGAWESPVSKFRGASDALADTWTGLMSMLQDAWFQFRVAVMDAGVFKFMKAAIKNVLDTIRQLKAEGKLDAWAQQISDTLIYYAKAIIKFMGEVYDAVSNTIGSLMGMAADLMATFNSIKDRINGVGDAVAKAQEQIADDEAMNRASANVGRYRDQLTQLERSYKQGAVSAEEFASEQTRLGALLNQEEVSLKVLAATRTSFNTQSERDIYIRESQIVSLKKYAEELTNSNRGREFSLTLLRKINEAEAQFDKNQEERNKNQQQRRALRKPEAFRFSAEEEEARAAALGALELKKAIVELNQEYKSGKVDAEGYYAEKTKLQQEQYEKELSIQLTALDKLEAIEIQRRQDIYEQIATIKKQVDEGTIAADDAVTQQRLLDLGAQYEADKNYLVNRRKIGEELLKLETANQQQIYENQGALADARLKFAKEAASQREKLEQESVSRELSIARATLEGSQLLAREQLLQEEELKREHDARRDELLEAVRQGYLTELDLKIAHDQMVEEQEAVHQGNMSVLKKSVEDEAEAAAKAEEERTKKQVELARSAASDSASAFKDMYQAWGKEAKGFFYVWKAMQIAETIISTYTAAQKAYNAYADIQYVGPVLGGIAAGVAVAQGLARVAMIRSQTLAAGGEVNGSSPTTTADNIPAMLTAGEYVQPVNAVKHYGLGVMEALRQRAIPKNVLSGFSAGGLAPPSNRFMSFASGGVVPATDREDDGVASGGAGPINITNVVDPQIMEQYVTSKPGERNIMNVISKNQFKLKQLMAQ